MKRRLWPRPRSLRGRFTIANVAFLAAGLVLAAAASIAATYMVLIGQIDASLKESQGALRTTELGADGLRRLCTLADLLMGDGNAPAGTGSSSAGGSGGAGGTGGTGGTGNGTGGSGSSAGDGGTSRIATSIARAFEQDLLVVLDPQGRPASVCQNSALPVGAEQQHLVEALPDPAELAARGGTATVQSGSREYRVAAVRLSDGTIVVKGIRLSGVKHAIGKLLVWEGAAGVVLLALLATGSLTAARRRLSPLEDMVETASAIAEGDLSRRIATARHGSEEVEQLSTALNAMLQQIETALTESERATAQLRQFIADASHELRTPLASVRGYLQLYEKDMLDADEKERALGRVSAEALRMSRLVDELLALARLEDRPALAFRPVDLCALIRDAAADLAAQQPERPMTVLLPGGSEGGDGVRVLGDEAGLRKVVGNVLSNVRVHTPAESPVTLEVVAAAGGHRAALRISDTGPGLSAEDAARAFDRFFRAAPHRARETGGAGLGMSIVQAVVHAHHGTVHLDTAPAKGLTVRITLPSAPR